MYICVDFDGTIVDHRFPEIGKPVPDAIKWLKRIHNAGGKLILYTMRSDGKMMGSLLTDAVNYLRSEGVELFGVNKNPTQESWTSSPKAYGEIYIDTIYKEFMVEGGEIFICPTFLDLKITNIVMIGFLLIK